MAVGDVSGSVVQNWTYATVKAAMDNIGTGWGGTAASGAFTITEVNGGNDMLVLGIQTS